ncbi:hypothetical protein PDJAM_G00031520 [Pangasius djambal]|uniref:Uncharacterized protein n=1 Tax=Pangasius djambal TaxID=1691987 RepID=A0ACC5YRX5_9TELE|nr:hypothetical protein [Pangasius djambal]
MEGSKSSSTTMQVSFVCQRCNQPLKLDTSFNVLDRLTIQELIAPLVTVTPSKQAESGDADGPPEETFVESKQDGVSRKYIPPARMMSTESANSFTLIGEASDGGTMENLSRRLKVTSDLFDIMSGQSDVDHPLCEECTDTLLDHLDTQLNITENECQNYKKCLELLSQLPEEDEDTLLKELQQLRQEEETLIQELEAIEQQRESVAMEITEARRHAQQLDTEELHTMEGSKSSSTTMQVSFVCQRCNQPLKLDTSFNVLDRLTIQELIAPLVTVTPSKQAESGDADGPPEETFVESKQDGVSRKYIPPARMMSTESANSFTLIGEASDGGTMENLSRRLKVTSDLFDIMSGQSDVDHPLCEECTDTLLDHLDTQLNITENECQNYKKCLELLSQLPEEDEDTLLKELQQLRQEEETLIQELEAIEQQRESVAMEITEARRHAQQLDTEELQHSGQFGTINNFRLGRLPSVPVEWNEINAAWGQTVLLLHALANKMGLRFQRYRLVPYGNHSYLESLTDKSKELPLYCSGGLRFFWDNKFDHAMVAFLDCVQQFKEEVEKGDTGFCLPYRMDVDKGKIEDTGGSGGSYSIKTQFNSEEQWTKALKFMLTNLKWGLAWVSSQFYNR